MTKTNAELRDEYIAKAIDAEKAAEDRKQVIRRKVVRETMLKWQDHRPKKKVTKQEFDDEVDMLTNFRCAGSSVVPGDPMWKGLVSRNQWYTGYATMYGVAANADAMKSLEVTLQTLAVYLRDKA